MTDFLWDVGSSGFTTAPFDFQTTELNGLGNSDSVVSSVNGGSSNGIFTQTDTGSALWTVASFVSGAAFTPSASAPSVSVWYITKADNTNFEKIVNNTQQPRAPDFIIPLFASAYASNDLALCQGGLVRLPACPFKVLVYNGSGVPLPATGNKLVCGPVAVSKV